jgi:transcriptional regulator with PAS, ATPase and Fis domain
MENFIFLPYKHLFFIKEEDQMMECSFNVDQLRIYLESGKTEEILDLFQQLFEQYQLQKARLDTLLDTVNEAVCMIDQSDKVVEWNHRAASLYGIQSEEILYKLIEPFFQKMMLSTAMKERRPVEEQF